MRNLKLTLAYDGTNYFGWQAQEDKPTVQVTLEAAVAQITGEKVRLHASGRTDTGVHALGQVASIHSATKLEPAVLRKALNAVLPEDIAVLDVREAPDDFHPRYSAKRKHYRYLLYDEQVRDVFMRNYSWHYKKGRLNADAMHRAAQSLVGTHDFTSFESSGAKRKTSVRTVFSLVVQRFAPASTRSEEGRAGEGDKNDSSFRNEFASTLSPFFENHPLFSFPAANSKDWITLDIIADGFLYNMVRSILGTLVEVGRGTQPENWPGEVLRAADRRAAGPTAPPQGLFLMSVCYGDEG
jgi:tRNA pseudouridine38-40 synthase